jgi:uncharacterized protein (DUF302 family)
MNAPATPLRLNIRIKSDFEGVVKRTADALKAAGFDIITQIDIQETLKKKLDVNLRPYKILGVCNPSLTHRALTIAPEVGMLLPCNAVVMQLDENYVEVLLSDPVAMFSIIGKPYLKPIAEEVHARFERVMLALQD